MHEKSSRSRQRGGWNLDGEVDDAEAGGLLGDHGDVAGAGDGVGHAGVEARLREEANVGGAGAGGGARESDWISTEIAAVRRGVESAKGGNVEIEEAKELSTPAVVGSTTAIFLPEIEGDELVREMTSSVVPGATTMRDTMLERVPMGVCI